MLGKEWLLLWLPGSLMAIPPWGIIVGRYFAIGITVQGIGLTMLFIFLYRQWRRAKSLRKET